MLRLALRPLALLLLVFVQRAAAAEDDAIPAVAAPSPPPDAVVAELPFEPYPEPNRVVVDLAPDGQPPFRLMLDTGASDSVLTPRLARQLGVTVRRTKSSPYRKATRLGRDLLFWVNTRRGDTASNVGWEYGLLGGTFLDDFVTEIDFPGRRVRFLDPKKYEVPAVVSTLDERVIPIRIQGTRIGVEIEMNERAIHVMLDTGDPGTLTLSGKAARKLGIDVAGLREYGQVGTTMGPMEIHFHETESFRFAGFEFDTMPVLVAPKGWYNIAGPTDSTVGYDVLSQFLVRIDYERRRMWLKRTGSPRVTFRGADYELSRRVGALVSPSENGYTVWGVEPAGAAAAYGLRNGDVVVVPAGDEMISIEAVLARIEAREELTVARREGDVWIDRILPEADLTEGDPSESGDPD
jgi:predicted aspartyl protease